MPSVVRPETQQKIDNIRKDYFADYGKGLRTELIITRLATAYFMTPDTIMQIVFKRGYYRNV